MSIGCAAIAAVAPWWARPDTVGDNHLVLQHGVGLVGDLIVRGWAVGLALLCLVLVVEWSQRLACRRLARSLPPGRRFALSMVTVFAVVSIGLAASSDLLPGARYSVLEPAGPDGCRVVTREVSALLGVSGDVYLVDGGGVAWRAVSWVSDDAYGPYELDWGAEAGVLTISGTTGDPEVTAGQYALDC